MRKENLYKNFWKNGYVILKNYVSKKEINKIFNQINDLTNISLNEKISLKNNKDLDLKYLKLKNKSPKLKSHIYDLSKYCDSLVEIASSKKFLDISKLLLKSKTVFIDTPQVRVDHPKEKTNLPQHQELNQISKDVITFWVPLVDINKNNGGIYFRPKTHELGHVKYKDYHLSATAAGQKRVKILNKLFNKKENKKYKSISPKLNAGDVVIFHSFIFHGTKPNRSNKVRWVYIARHNSIKTAPYLKKENYPLRIPYNEDYNTI